ncbi:HNH endonuclease [Clostridioides difficile]|nr:HNH endonuclease [Clostridioides difficile]
MDNRVNKAFEQWKLRIKGSYIRAICKPCWELKYCPYGYLVEAFSIEDDEYSCRIFGHQCPAFYLAEPFTETKELRNISRNIPQVVKLKVFKRDGQVCQLCRKNICEEEINFDHVIPWSKGGSSDESNIRVLCEECNKKRSNNFENEYLIMHIKESFHDPPDINLEMLEDLLRLFLLMIRLKSESMEITEKEYCSIIDTNDIETDQFIYMLVSSIESLFKEENSFIKVKVQMEMLRYRWGVKDKKIHSIKETCNKFGKDIDYYVKIEMLLLRQLGFILQKKYRNSNEYYESTVEIDFI